VITPEPPELRKINFFYAAYCQPHSWAAALF